MKILHMISTINDNGGIQKILYSYLNELKNSEIRESIIAHEGFDSKLAKAFIDIGCNLYEIEPRKTAGLRYYRLLFNRIRTLSYDIFHIHIGYKSLLPLLISKACHPKAKVIVHVHSNRTSDSITINMIKKLCVIGIKLFADSFFACGKDAAIWFFGTKFFEGHKVYIMKNALPHGVYGFSEEDRIKIRKELGIREDAVVYGHVGTFYEPKNQIFLLEVFKEIHKIDNNSRLVMVGDGELREKLQKKAEDLGINEATYFTGVRTDVPGILSALDVFLLPSLYEGFPMSLLEAQCSGLPCYTSTNVTDEVNVTGLVRYYSLSKSAYDWSQFISMTFEKMDIERYGYKELIQKKGYTIEQSARDLYLKYQQIIEEK